MILNPNNKADLRECLNRVLPLPEELLDRVVGTAAMKEIKKGNYFVIEGQLVHEVAFVEYGGFRLFHHDGRQETTRDFTFAGQLLANLTALLNQQQSDIGIQALMDSKILVFEYKRIEALGEQSAMIERLHRKVIEQAYIKMRRHYLRLLHTDSKERYLDLVESEPWLLQQVPLRHIASYLKITPQHLSRIRREVLS